MNGLRIAITILALVLDVLVVGLSGLTLLLRHLTGTQLLGGTVILVVTVPNIPALVWALVPRRRGGDGQVAARVFD
jgi:hypothetical protein